MRAMKRLMILAALGLCAACGGTSSPTASATHSTAPTPSPSPTVTHTPKPKPTTITVKPELEIKTSLDGLSLWTKTSHGCKGANGASDSHVGEGITVYNASGHKVIGIGFARHSFVLKDKCYIYGTIKHLPIIPFYKVQFGTGNKVAFSKHGLVNQTEVTVEG